MNSLLDDVEVKDLRAFEDGYYPYLESAHPDILKEIATKKALDDDLRKRLTDAINEYKGSFLTGLKDKDSASSKELVGSEATNAAAMVGNR